MLKIKAQIIDDSAPFQKVEEMSIDRVYDLLKLKLQIELEQRRDVGQIKAELLSEEISEEQKALIR